MKPQKNTASPCAEKRDIFDEMMEGIAVMKAHREGKIILRKYKREKVSFPEAE